MKARSTFTLLTATALAALLLLGACGQKKEEAAAPASSSKTSQVSQSSSASSKKDSRSSASAQTEPQTGQGYQEAAPATSPGQAGTSPAAAEQAPAQSQQQASPAQAPQPAQRANISPSSNPRYKGVQALADGDFSKAAGTWEDGQGNVITIGGNGSISIQQSGQEAKTYSVGSYAYTLDDGKYTAQLTSPTPGAGTPGIQIITGADGNVTSVQLVK